MITPATSDAIIAGGGVAGSVVAAALAEFGFRVLIVEPGLDHVKRLAGELIHPPGVADLSELGLLNCLKQAGGVPVHGFVVLPGATTSSHRLPYSECRELKNQGLAIEHSALAERLLEEITKLSHVTVWKGARVTGIDVTSDEAATVTVARGVSEYRLRTPLLVAADGRNSHLRRMAGIGQKQIHLSSMIGYLLKDSRLPFPGFGHVFAGGPAPMLAYQIADGETRIMFDLPLQSNGQLREQMTDYLKALPLPLRANVERAIETQAPLKSANYSVKPEAVVKGRLVCVGDAGGACHPLTATGLSACTRDARLLRQALRESAGGIPGALYRYSRLREGPQRTRQAGAEILYDLFKSQTPDMRLLRQGLFRYWQNGPQGRAATMALLSTQEDRMSVLMREYIKVCRYALPDLIRWSGEAGTRPSDTRSHAMIGLSRALLRFVK